MCIRDRGGGFEVEVAKWQSGKVSVFCHLDFAVSLFKSVIPVSYTHLDVYKRQGHASTAFLVAGSSPRIASVSSISHQKVGLAGEVSGQKQPTVQSRYSANAKHSTPLWKYRIFRAAPVCVFA